MTANALPPDPAAAAPDAFAASMQGSFRGVLQWAQLDALWARVRASPAGWYAAIGGEPPPAVPLGEEALLRFIDELDALLRKEHRYDYCGIVYVDDPAAPTLVKVFDPNDLGSACSAGAAPTPPRWILSRLRPTAIAAAAPLPGSRRRWWQRLFG